MIHPTTIRGKSPKDFALEFSTARKNEQAAIMHALADDLQRQVDADEKAGKPIIANDMFNAIPHIIEGGFYMFPGKISRNFMSNYQAIAKEIGSLRYDSMVDFFKSYSTITANYSLTNATYCVGDAWEHTPLSWKKEFAPETLKNYSKQV